MEHTHKTPEDLHFVPQVFTLALAVVLLCINYVFRWTFWSETEPYSYFHHLKLNGNRSHHYIFGVSLTKPDTFGVVCVLGNVSRPSGRMYLCFWAHTMCPVSYSLSYLYNSFQSVVFPAHSLVFQTDHPSILWIFIQKL